jgi:uncharacterized DUF497 family protein
MRPNHSINSDALRFAARAGYASRYTFPLDNRISQAYTYTMSIDEVISSLSGFDWDEGNLLKNWEKHRVSASECEQVFFNRPLLTQADAGHSTSEARYFALGQSDSGRHLFIVFTVRGTLLRVISARDMCRKERKAYQAS